MRYLRRPWVWLGGGSRRVVASYAGRYNDEKWNYELIKSWMLGLEINQDYYGRYPARFSQWGAAKRVAFCAPLPLAFAAAFAFLTLRRGCRHSLAAGSRPLDPNRRLLVWLLVAWR